MGVVVFVFVRASWIKPPYSNSIYKNIPNGFDEQK